MTMGGITSGSSVMNSTTGRRRGSFRRTQKAVGATISTPSTIVATDRISEYSMVW